VVITNMADASWGLDQCANSTRTGATLAVCAIGDMKPILDYPTPGLSR
jgi:hypothetical protein